MLTDINKKEHEEQYRAAIAASTVEIIIETQNYELFVGDNIQRNELTRGRGLTNVPINPQKK